MKWSSKLLSSLSLFYEGYFYDMFQPHRAITRKELLCIIPALCIYLVPVRHNGCSHEGPTLKKGLPKGSESNNIIGTRPKTAAMSRKQESI